MSSVNYDSFFSSPPIQPRKEILAYESLWAEIEGVSFKSLNDVLRGERPSSFIERIPQKKRSEVDTFLSNHRTYQYNFLIRQTVDYPENLNVLELPIIYYQGNLSLLSTPCVSIVGARESSPRGLDAAYRIASSLAQEGYTIVSGLASGIDTQAHTGAIDSKGRTIGVIGTPINSVYPKSNKELQEKIASEHLLISHIPFYKYSLQNWKINRFFFPERNKVMAALSSATIIVEASNKSGTLTQARAALSYNKKVIILKPTAENKDLTWPKTYINRGAFVAETVSDIKKILGQ